MDQKRERAERRAGAAFVGIYFVVRMLADSLFWRQISEYYSYAFELAFVALVAWYYRSRRSIIKLPTTRDAMAAVLAFVAGFFAYRGAGWMRLPIPFDLSTAETLTLLLVVAPVLEEAIFRMALWEALKSWTPKGGWLIAWTTVLFASAHLSAFPFVPPMYKGFVLYQTAYVTLLGLAAAYTRMRSGALVPAIAVHAAFNLGFLMGTLVI